MNLFCRLFGHTWLPVTRTPLLRWNTTKEGHTLVPAIDGEEIRHLEVCRRCGAERDLGRRRHDADRPARTLGWDDSPEEEEQEQEAS
jgi:hypothetical protein